MDEARLVIRLEGSSSGSTSPGGLPTPQGSGGGGGTPSKPLPDPEKQPFTAFVRDILTRAGISSSVLDVVSKGVATGNRAAAAAGSGLAAIGVSGAAIGLVGGAAAGFVGTAAIVAGAEEINRRSTEAAVGNFSPALEVAKAFADVRRINRQLSQAAIFGDELAGITTTRSKIRDEFSTLFQKDREFALQFQNAIEFGVLLMIKEIKGFFVNDILGANEAILPDWLKGTLTAIRLTSAWISKQQQAAFLGRFPPLVHLPLPAEFAEGDTVPTNVTFDNTAPNLDPDFN